MEAFNGPSRCLATEKFLRKYQDENCYTNCGNVRPNTTQKFALSTEFEVKKIMSKMYTLNNSINEIVFLNDSH